MGFIDGYLVGLAMIVFIGPVLFTLVEASLSAGKAAGFMVALGIITGDAIIVSALLLGLNKIEFPTWSIQVVTLGGAAVLFFLGVKNLFRNSIKEGVHLGAEKNLFIYFGKGFAVNFINPFVFIVWTGLYVFSTSSPNSNLEPFYYLVGVLAGIFTLDIAKVFLANKIKPLLKERSFQILRKTIGIIMIGFGIRLLVYLFTL